jgi:hypothetical protein
MKKQTRRFVFVAAGILVFGLGTGLVASYMGLQNIVLIGRDGPAELAYIPADARAVAYANVREVMDSELRKKIMQHIHPGGTDDADRFKQETGIDIQTDVDEVVATITGTGTEQRPLVITRGRFNPTQIESLAREHGSTVEEYKGTRLLVHPSAEVGVAFLEAGVVAVGTPQSVRRAIDTKADGQDVRKNEELMRLVRDIDDGNAWTVAHFDAITGGRQLPPEIANQLPPITWFAASGYVNGGVRGMVRVDARDETSAQDLRQVVQGFIALARLQVGSRPEFADVLNSLQLGGTGTTVSLGFSIPSEVIDALGAAAAQGRPVDRRDPVLRERQPLPQLPAL